MIAPLALTCGEPAGIGPEIAVAAYRQLRGAVPAFYIGDPDHLPPDTGWHEITDPKQAATRGDSMPVLPHPFPQSNRPGHPTPENAASVIEVIERAVALAQSGAAGGVVTGPIHKKALQDGANFAYPGHTEFLAHLGGAGRVVMMLASDGLRVVPATIHIALADVKQALTASLLCDTIRITADGLQRDFGLSHPRIAIAGLNPHAGEGGAMGDDEITLIAPVIAEMQQQGYVLTGPHSADTLFHAAARQTYDAVIAMYHDQALIPIKTLAFDTGVNVTLGLPFIRTSPDHGTALDIAGKGIANPSSMVEAMRMAASMARARQA
ncbi:4-hydroxythreonine-4-phosphate dehydrogenase PdxA [Actibacterium sp. 188UL27-1]|uniref:4-hydroxythreonine-4-phosphate dehydrogenase PdxA n=1 Tax=Actibacterium sp. 188UL27-1 TaxID=2786961 RepID=UPI001956A1E3|nr:4-hydroxythreonine-4-phosphate dehydrogenase PdxA [Actibacterium sp. 188UL27-1]MBM7067484.1 4-hydroxythreonine-4-phosphate dehydrogenase PdxA [Actibacterium sp. 188UL27-1]